LIIHQVAAARDALLAIPAFKALLAHHTQPSKAGTVFTSVKPKLAVYYHFVLLGTPTVPAVTEKMCLNKPLKGFCRWKTCLRLAGDLG
jgi:ribonuclease Z